MIEAIKYSILLGFKVGVEFKRNHVIISVGDDNHTLQQMSPISHFTDEYAKKVIEYLTNKMYDGKKK